MPSLPALTVETKQIPARSRNSNADHEYHRSASPEAPPYSPITPVMSSTSLFENTSEYQYAPPQDVPPQDVPQPPPPIPISETENPDAVALRAALSILQIQRLQTLRDMKNLEQQKKAAVADPERFAAAVANGKVKTISGNGLVVGPTLEVELKTSPDDFQDSALDSDLDDEQPLREGPRFENIPGPQNVVRMPPVNWAKYHIIGESLDRLHEEQRARPTPGQPRRDEDLLKAPEHVIAAPYNPWTDKVAEPYMRTRSHARREN